MKNSIRNVALIFFMIQAVAQAKTVSNRAEAQIRKSLVHWPKDIARGDQAAACDLFAKNTVLSFPGQPDHDYAFTCERLRKAIKAKGMFRYDEPQIEEIHVSGNLAFVRLIWTMHEKQPDGSEEIIREKGLDVFMKQADGKYRIRVSHAFPVN